MTAEEIRVRSIYLFLACSHAVEQFMEQLVATFPSPPLSSTLVLQQALRKELGMLFRYWTTRQIWQQLESQEQDAKALNVSLLRLFTNAFQLPKDGTGLRYAELSTLAEEIQELSRRLTSALGMTHPPLLDQLRQGIGPWHEAVHQHTADALALPLDQLALKVRDWANRFPVE